MMTERKIRPGRITDAQVDAYRQARADAEASTAVLSCSEHDMGDCPYHRNEEAEVRTGLAAAYVQRERERIADALESAVAQREAVPGMPMEGPYPATVDEVADGIARYVLELEASGVARGLSGMVRARLMNRALADRRVISDECLCSRTERMYCHSSKCHGGADVVEP